MCSVSREHSASIQGKPWFPANANWSDAPWFAVTSGHRLLEVALVVGDGGRHELGVQSAGQAAEISPNLKQAANLAKAGQGMGLELLMAGHGQTTGSHPKVQRCQLAFEHALSARAGKRRSILHRRKRPIQVSGAAVSLLESRSPTFHPAAVRQPRTSFMIHDCGIEEGGSEPGQTAMASNGASESGQGIGEATRAAITDWQGAHDASADRTAGVACPVADVASEALTGAHHFKWKSSSDPWPVTSPQNFTGCAVGNVSRLRHGERWRKTGPKPVRVAKPSGGLVARMGDGGESTGAAAEGKLNKTEQNWYVFQFLTARVMQKENEQGEKALFGTIGTTSGRAPGSGGGHNWKPKAEILTPEYTRTHQNVPKHT